MGMQARLYTARYSFARPGDVTPYTATDLVANSTTAAQVVPLKFNVEKSQGRGRITRVRLFTNAANVVTATFNLHLYVRDPGVPTNGDNGTFGVASVQYWLATIACDLATGAEVYGTSKQKGFPIAAPGFTFDCGVDGAAANAQTIFGLLEAAGGYTPASGEVFETSLEIEG